MAKTKELSKELVAKVYPVKEIHRKTVDGNDITYPTLAYAHVLIDTAFGDLVVRGYRILEGKEGKPFVARPGKSRKIYDENHREVGTQRFNDVRISGENDREFDRALKDKILKAFES